MGHDHDHDHDHAHVHEANERNLRRVLVALVLTLSGCEVVTKQHVGAGVGGIAGALAGSFFGSGTGTIVATALGGVAGGLAGSEIGGRLDRADQEQSKDAFFEALENAPDGRTVSWENPKGRTGGSTTPTETSTEGPSVCRDFIQNVSVESETASTAGKACRDSDGTWEITEQAS